MEVQDIIKKAKQEMKKAVDHTLSEFGTLHTGKASASMIDNINVDVYGSMMKIRDIAAITTPDMRTIQVQPWDKSSIQPIEKAIQSSNLGITPVSNGNVIRLPIPELSGDRRKELAKVANSMAEHGRVGVRAGRKDGMDALKTAQKDGAISEDDFKRYEKEIQKITDDYNAEITKLLTNKEKELNEL
jgi:ribosome recycling factor